MENFEYICSQQYEWALAYRKQEDKRKLQKNREEKSRAKKSKIISLENINGRSKNII
jgi:hypothetical protein